MNIKNQKHRTLFIFKCPLSGHDKLIAKTVHVQLINMQGIYLLSWEKPKFIKITRSLTSWNFNACAYSWRRGTENSSLSLSMYKGHITSIFLLTD